MQPFDHLHSSHINILEFISDKLYSNSRIFVHAIDELSCRFIGFIVLTCTVVCFFMIGNEKQLQPSYGRRVLIFATWRSGLCLMAIL